MVISSMVIRVTVVIGVSLTNAQVLVPTIIGAGRCLLYATVTELFPPLPVRAELLQIQNPAMETSQQFVAFRNRRWEAENLVPKSTRMMCILLRN